MEGFVVRVYSSGNDRFHVRVAAATPTVDEVKEAIKRTDEGRQLDFTMLWKVFPADQAGAIVDNALNPDDPFPVPPQGSTVNVRVQRMGEGEAFGRTGACEGGALLQGALLQRF